MKYLQLTLIALTIITIVLTTIFCIVAWNDLHTATKFLLPYDIACWIVITCYNITYLKWRKK